MDDINWKKPYQWLFLYAFALIGVGFVFASPMEILYGLEKIILSSDILITDYIELAGVGPAFVNVGLVVVITNLLMYVNKMPIKSGNIVTIGLMSGFAFFGKNIFNMWFILLGTYLFCALRREALSKYLLQSFWASSLGPLISSTFFHQGDITVKSVLISVCTGLIIGFVTPVLTGYTQRIQHGLNLYNGGFATGLMAMMLTPILKAFGYEFEPVSIWSTEYNLPFTAVLIITGLILIVMGIASDENAVKNYRNSEKNGQIGVPLLSKLSFYISKLLIKLIKSSLNSGLLKVSSIEAFTKPNLSPESNLVAL